MDIVKISDSSYKDVPPTGDFPTISDCIAFLPHKNEIISKYILDVDKKENCKEKIKDIIKEHLESERVEVLLSTVLYAKRLGIDLAFEEIKITGSGFHGMTVQMSEVSKIKVLEYLERIRQFILEGDGQRTDVDVLVYFFCISIIKNFRFSVTECLRELRSLADDKVILTAIAFLSDSEEPAYLLSLTLRLPEPHHLLHLPMDKRLRDLLIALLLTGSPLPWSPRLKEFIDDETVDVLVGLVPLDYLASYLPEYNLDTSPISSIRKEDFTISKSKEKFFRDFCLLGSPSVSHFLSYLEIYKDHFILSEEDQRLFVDIFRGIFGSRRSFSRIILSKMVLFGILDKKII